MIAGPCDKNNSVAIVVVKSIALTTANERKLFTLTIPACVASTHSIIPANVETDVSYSLYGGGAGMEHAVLGDEAK